MRPAHGNFDGFESVVARQVQQFGVKAETLDALLFENDVAALASEGLEAALRIHERKPQNASNYAIENDSGKFAERRFVHFDESAIHRARSDRHVILP